MNKYWKLVDFCDKRKVIECESEEECISLIHDTIHRTVPSEEWGELEISSSQITSNEITFVCYTAISVKYIRFFFYFYDSYEEELDDQLIHNQNLNATLCKLSERSEKDEIEYLKETIKRKENRIDELMCENKKLKHENEDIEKALVQRDDMLKQISDVIYPF